MVCFFLVLQKKKQFAGENKRDVTVAGVDPHGVSGGRMAMDPFAVKWKVPISCRILCHCETTAIGDL